MFAFQAKDSVARGLAFDFAHAVKVTVGGHDAAWADLGGFVEVAVVPIGVWPAAADVCEVGAGAHCAEEDGLFVDVVAGDGRTVAPAALDVGGCDVGLADLLAMAIDTACGGVNALAGDG